MRQIDLLHSGDRFIGALRRWGARNEAFFAGLTDVYPRVWHREQ